MTYEPIYTNIRTTAERGAILAGIETILEALYKRGEDMARIIDTEMPGVVARPFKQQLAKLPDSSPEATQTYLEGLRDALAQLRILSLELAFEPTEETIAVLMGWVREQIGTDVIMEFSVDRTLLGGARISFGGQYKEINLGFLVESVIQQKWDSIQTILEEASP